MKSHILLIRDFICGKNIERIKLHMSESMQNVIKNLYTAGAISIAQDFFQSFKFKYIFRLKIILQKHNVASCVHRGNIALVSWSASSLTQRGEDGERLKLKTCWPLSGAVALSVGSKLWSDCWELCRELSTNSAECGFVILNYFLDLHCVFKTRFLQTSACVFLPTEENLFASSGYWLCCIESRLTRLLGLIFLVSTFFSAVILFTDIWASFNLQKQCGKFNGLIRLRHVH